MTKKTIKKPTKKPIDKAHRANVIKMLLCCALTVVCFTLCNEAMSHHWEERYMLACLFMGLCYMMSIFGFVFEDGFATPPKPKK